MFPLRAFLWRFGYPGTTHVPQSKADDFLRFIGVVVELVAAFAIGNSNQSHHLPDRHRVGLTWFLLAGVEIVLASHLVGVLKLLVVEGEGQGSPLDVLCH